MLYWNDEEMDIEEDAISTENSADSSAPFAPGTIVQDKYIVDECLGVGSRSTVYKCHQRGLEGASFVLKVLHSDLAEDEVVAARFEKEILTAYGVSHHNVIRLFECIKNDNLLAYTMEYASGGSLKELLKSKQSFSIEQGISILEQLCSGLQAIHSKGIVHRDLKPKNILFMEDGTLKIADFGLVHTSSGRKLTAQGEVLGAVDFVSPEYVKSGEIDQRSDIYSVGLIAYELVTGGPAFKGASLMDTLMKRLSTDPEHPMKRRVDCPPELDGVIMKALKREPAERYQHAGEMVIDLERLRLKKLGHGSDLHSEIIKAQAEPASKRRAKKASAAATAQRLKRAKSSSPLTPSLILRLLILALLVGGFLYTLGGDEAAKPTEIVVVPPPNDQKKDSLPEKSALPDNVSRQDVAAVLGDDSTEVFDFGELEQEASPENDEASAETAEPSTTEYTVKPGDTVSAIAAQYGVDVQRLMEANKLDDPRKLQVGAALTIPGK